jgi:hypothetical protein
MNPERTTVRFNADDLALLEALSVHMGLRNRTAVLRVAIRALADREGIKRTRKGK